MKINNSLVTGAVVLVVAAPLGYNLLTTNQEKVRLVQTNIAQERSTQQAQAELAATLRQIEQYRKRLAPEPNPSWLVNAVLAIGEQAGLQITTISQEVPRELPQFTRLAADIELTTSYHQLGNFLSRIEGADHFIQVENLEITPPRDTGGPIAVRLVLSTIYVRPVQKLVAGGA